MNLTEILGLTDDFFNNNLRREVRKMKPRCFSFFGCYARERQTQQQRNNTNGPMKEPCERAVVMHQTAAVLVTVHYFFSPHVSLTDQTPFPSLDFISG